MFLVSKNQMSQRKFQRYRVNFEIRYSYNGKISKCEIINISDDGMLIKIPQILEVGDIIILLFDEHNETFINAVVRHKNYNYVGVCFIKTIDDYLAKIKDFINDIKNKNRILININQMMAR